MRCPAEICQKFIFLAESIQLQPYCHHFFIFSPPFSCTPVLTSHAGCKASMKLLYDTDNTSILLQIWCFASQDWHQDVESTESMQQSRPSGLLFLCPSWPSGTPASLTTKLLLPLHGEYVQPTKIQFLAKYPQQSLSEWHTSQKQLPLADRQVPRKPCFGNQHDSLWVEVEAY